MKNDNVESNFHLHKVSPLIMRPQWSYFLPTIQYKSTILMLQTYCTLTQFNTRETTWVGFSRDY